MKIKPIIVTLTSIPPRYENLPRRFASIGCQSVRPDFVELYIPKTYRRFPGQRPSLPNIPDWVDVIEVDEDLGPATKILPATKKWRLHEVDLLLCDDDRSHDRRWISRFAEARRERPKDIICERAWNIDERYGIKREELDEPRARRDEHKGLKFVYKLVKLLTFKKYHYHVPRKIYLNSGYGDVFEGFLGVLAPPLAFHDDVWNIPDIVWTVDDVWLSGMAKANGYNVWVNAKPRPIYHDRKYDKIAALKNYEVGGVCRDDAELVAINLLRSKYGIWK